MQVEPGLIDEVLCIGQYSRLKGNKQWEIRFSSSLTNVYSLMEKIGTKADDLI